MFSVILVTARHDRLLSVSFFIFMGCGCSFPHPALHTALLLNRHRLPRTTPEPTPIASPQQQAGGLFVAQPISELHLSSSVALVLCLRPRLKQAPLVPEANMSRREKLANEMVENGQAATDTDKAGDDGEGKKEEKEEAKEPTLEEQVMMTGGKGEKRE